MFSLGSSHRFYLYDGNCDMRKSFDGLCGLVASAMERRPTSGEVFVFLNRNRTHIKLLHWESGGFVLYNKRLEQGVFSVPWDRSRELSRNDLALMVECIRVVRYIRKNAFHRPENSLFICGNAPYSSIFRVWNGNCIGEPLEKDHLKIVRTHGRDLSERDQK